MNIEEYGFRKAGKWELEKDTGKISYKIDSFSDLRTIFAIVIDGSAKYLGICETKNSTLDERLDKIEKKKGSGANDRLLKEIKNEFKKGKEVHIYAMPDMNKQYYNEIEIDLVMGLKYPLIEKINPPWNKKK